MEHIISYGRRGNEIIKVMESGESVDIRVVLLEGNNKDLATYEKCIIPRKITKITKQEGKLRLIADKTEYNAGTDQKRFKLVKDIGELILWPAPEQHLDLSRKEDREEWDRINEVKRIVEEYNAIHEDELWDMDITVIMHGAYGKFNQMSSLEDGYEKGTAERIDDAGENANPVRKLNAKYLGAAEDSGNWDFDVKEVGREYMTILKELADEGVLQGVDANDMKFAMQFAFDRRRGFDDTREKDKEELVNTIRELIRKRDIPKEDKEIWIRGLCSSLYDFEVRQYVEQLTLREVNQYYLPAMKDEADETPGGSLMSWYKEILGKNICYGQECIIYNKLAYFYLWYYKHQFYLDQARAYFRTMERRGIEFANPYKAFYNNNRHTELVNVLLDGGHEDDMALFIEDYYRRLEA